MFAKTTYLVLAFFVMLCLVTTQCNVQPEAEKEHLYETEVSELAAVRLGDGERLKVVVTTSIVADIVKNVGGDKIDLNILLPIGTDPHTFAPSPADLATVADAHVIFANGMGLEAFLDEMIENAGSEAAVVYVSQGIEARQFDQGEENEHETYEEAHDPHEGTDPHTWTSPTNVIIFVHNIERTLGTRDPANARIYAANAKAYEVKLKELDAWVKTRIETIPPENRKLVTDHTTFGYYADHYGLQQIGAIIPSFSTAAEPSAKELAKLEEAIKNYNVKAIFVGTSVNPSLAQRVSNDTGTKLVSLYTGSLGPEGSGVESYLDYIRFNTEAIVEALK
jgi:manganese/iron transport system substrate-binding protein